LVNFDTDREQRQALLDGLDEIGLTLKLADRIDAFRVKDRLDHPWIYRTEETEPMQRVLILAGMALVRKYLPKSVASPNGSRTSAAFASTCAKSCSAFPRGNVTAR